MTRLRVALRESAWIVGWALILGFTSSAISEKGFFAPVPEASSERKAAPQFISLEEARALYENQSAIFVDGRHAYDFGLGHIKGAINIPLAEFSVAPSLLGNLSKETTLVTYCDGAECNSSIELAMKLDSLGYSNVRIFFGGWKEWQSLNLPTAQ